jgi:hypothetical protein
MTPSVMEFSIAFAAYIARAFPRHWPTANSRDGREPRTISRKGKHQSEGWEFITVGHME